MATLSTKICKCYFSASGLFAASPSSKIFFVRGLRKSVFRRSEFASVGKLLLLASEGRLVFESCEVDSVSAFKSILKSSRFFAAFFSPVADVDVLLFTSFAPAGGLERFAAAASPTGVASLLSCASPSFGIDARPLHPSNPREKYTHIRTK